VTVRKIGNSEGLILPKEVLERMNLKTGGQLEVVETADGLSPRPVDDIFERQMKAAREVMDQYKVALQSPEQGLWENPQPPNSPQAYVLGIGRNHAFIDATGAQP
jgi:putative addiction module antidote